MSLPFSLPPASRLVAALVFSVLVTFPFLPLTKESAPKYRLEVSLSAPQFGITQLFYGLGRDLSELDSVRIALESATPVNTSFPIPAGRLTALRLDPLDRSGQVTLSQARLVDPQGRELRRFPASQFRAAQAISSMVIGPAGELTVTIPDGSTDPILEIDLGAPIDLPSTQPPLLLALLTYPAPVFLLTLLALGWAPRWLGGDVSRRIASLRPTLSARPLRTLGIVAALAVIVSNYPVVFLGKSFASPNFGAALLYETTPTLPGLSDKRVEDVKGSDVGPLFWQNMTHAMIQRDALLAGEWPLWFRYNSAGTELLGQGQSMFGDPLHFLVIAASGSALAWDVKFLIAKWLLAMGLGVLALRVSGHLRSALIIAASAAFFGFFSFRINHPAFFSFCYAPWILVAWLRLTASGKTRDRWINSGWLLLANWTVLNSGTAKEAYMLLISLNATGALVVLTDAASWRDRLRAIAFAIGSGATLILLSAPIWLTFLDALRASFTTYNAPTAWQIHPTFLLGLFDEIFYRPLQPGERVSNPSANFIILGGILYLAASWRARPPGRLANALAIASIPAGLLAFGVIPPQWIQAIPFLGNVAHIDNCFSLVLIILGSGLAACGLRSAHERLGTADGRGDLAWSLLFLALLVLPWISAVHTVHKPIYEDGQRYTPNDFGETLPVSPFVWTALLVLCGSLLLIAWTWHRLKAGRIDRRAALLLLSCASFLIVARHLQHVGPLFADYVVNPPGRPTLLAKSAAVEAVRADMRFPLRTVGFEGNLFPGWGAAYRLEGISGPEALMNPYFRELADALEFDRIWAWRIMIHGHNLDRMRKRYDALNIGYYLDYRGGQGRFGRHLTPVAAADLDVYRSDSAWPRAFFTNQIASYLDPRDLARQIDGGDGRPFAALQGAAAQATGLPVGLPGRAVVAATEYRLTPNSTRFAVTATGPGLVVLNEAWQDGNFRAFLNGKPVAYLRVNHAFKAIRIPNAGRHEIEFRYHPRRFSLALALAGLGLLPVIAGGWYVWRKRQITPIA